MSTQVVASVLDRVESGVTVRAFLLRAIPYLANAYNARLTVKQAGGVNLDRHPTKGAHARSLNQTLRDIFPGIDPRAVTEAALAEGIIAMRPAKKGPMFFLASDAEAWEDAPSKQARDILATVLGE